MLDTRSQTPNSLASRPRATFRAERFLNIPRSKPASTSKSCTCSQVLAPQTLAATTAAAAAARVGATEKTRSGLNRRATPTAAGKAAADAKGAKFEPNYSSIEGFVAARVLTEALRRPGGAASSDGLIGALESLRELNLGGFFVDFSAQKHTGSRFVDMTILSADGKVRR